MGHSCTHNHKHSIHNRNVWLNFIKLFIHNEHDSDCSCVQCYFKKNVIPILKIQFVWIIEFILFSIVSKSEFIELKSQVLCSIYHPRSPPTI